MSSWNLPFPLVWVLVGDQWAFRLGGGPVVAEGRAPVVAQVLVCTEDSGGTQWEWVLQVSVVLP